MMTLFLYNSHLHSQFAQRKPSVEWDRQHLKARQFLRRRCRVRSPTYECRGVLRWEKRNARSDPATPDQYGIEHLFVVLFARRRYWWMRVSAALSHAAASYYPQCFVSIGWVYPTIDPRVPGDSLKTFRRKYSKRSRVATGNDVSRYLAITSR